MGIALAGHVVKALPVGLEALDLSFSLCCRRRWSRNGVKLCAEEAIDGCFPGLAPGWADQEEALAIRAAAQGA